MIFRAGAEGIYLGSEPVVEAMIAGIGLIALGIIDIGHVPFAYETGIVTLVSEQGGDSNFLPAKMDIPATEDRVKADAVWSPAGKK